MYFSLFANYVTFVQLKDIYIIREGYPVNRTITNAKMIFQDEDFNEIDFFSLQTNDRYKLTHKPLSEQDIISASPLHSYLRIFSWFMDLLGHLCCGKTVKWSPSSRVISDSRRLISSLVNEKTSLQIDLPNSQNFNNWYYSS